MKIVLIGLVVLVLAGVALFKVLAARSADGAPAGLIDGRLAVCPSTPNCVSSEEEAPPARRVAPLPLAAWPRIADVVKAQGGDIVVREDDYIASTFRSKIFGFVDDVEFRRAGDVVHIRSASRVGHGDMGANKARVEALRANLDQS